MGKDILKTIAGVALGVNPKTFSKKDKRDPLTKVLDPLAIFKQKNKDGLGKAAYEGDPTWVKGTTKMKSGGLVTQGSNKEMSRLTGKFKIV